MTSERRRFVRVSFDATSRLHVGDDVFDTQLGDISINGAFVALPEGWVAHTGASCELEILLAGDAVRVVMEGRVAHVSDRGVGVECTGMSPESAGHLRRLLLMNLGEAVLVEREVSALLAR